MSTSSAVSDTFAAAGYPNPMCSATYVLGCLNTGQVGCGGGNPGLLVKDISEQGIASDSCVDYSFCSKITGGDCSQVPGCGCYDPSGSHNLYFITNPKLLAVVDDFSYS